jgi:hypothetical protein
MPTCSDLAQNGGETDVDCGGATTCARCAVMKKCGAGADCLSGVCTSGLCQTSSCGDLAQNGGETDIDCGGATACARCVVNQKCAAPSDCLSNICTAGKCVAPSTICGSGTFALCDDFEDGNSTGWSPSGGTWAIKTDGSLVFQGANGSYNATAGSTAWTDQTVQARVKVVAFGGTSGSYRAGIIARYGGGSNYYTAVLEASGKMRILVGSSTVSACADLTQAVTTGTFYTLKLAVSGPASSVHIQSWLDGLARHDCTVTSGLASGTAGIITFGSSTVAEFDDVTVTTP